MKRILITSVLLGLAINAHSQFNYFFPDSNSYFSVSWMKFWFQGDTVIDDLRYKKVYEQSYDSIANFDNAYYRAAIREDTTAEKVYYYYEKYAVGGKEYLLYDFSVKVGDTVSYYAWWNIGGLARQVVESIDSILIDNQYRKKINFIHDKDWNGKYEESWIEGIGSTYGIFFAGFLGILDAMDRTHLLCVHIDGKLIYQNQEYQSSNCFLHNYGVKIDEHKKEIVKIFPTIVDNLLYIETDENIDGFDYKIMNVQGQIIDEGMLTSKIINVSNINAGFYLIRISENKKYIKIQKIVKL